MASKRLSLAEKISSLVTVAPTNFNSDDELDDTAAKVVEQEDDDFDDGENIRRSSFRTQNVDLLDKVDKRYVGKKVSRKTVQANNLPSDSEGDSESDRLPEGDSDDDIDEDSANDHDSEVSNDGEARIADDAESEGDDEIGTESDDEPELEVDEANPLRRREKTESNFQHMSTIDVRGEIEKGKCVRSQLSIWENLLEMRIKLQKCLVTSNKMPPHDVRADFHADKSFVQGVNESKRNLSNLLNNLLELRHRLLKNYPETKNLGTNAKLGKGEVKNEQDEEEIKSDTDEEIPSDTEEETEAETREEKQAEQEQEEPVPRKRRRLEDYEPLLSKDHKTYSEYRNSVIQKWNDKTRVGVGNVGNKGATQPLVKQIEFILSDKNKLVKRTQLKRSEYEILGKRSEHDGDQDGRRVQEYESEIYDDDDFYHQLLRELIEFKSSDVTDPIQLSKQWIQLQNMRSKMKRKIDTKATKGRRIRYGVHTKLVNFMAPITTDDNWSDETKTELYNSLFGKIKESEPK